MTSRRVRLFLSHLLLSALVIGSCIALIVLVWYPGALAEFDGVYGILLMMAIVDVGAGPLCTLVAAAPNKPRAELARDLSIIGVVQLIALGYAIYTTAIARPVFLVYSFGQLDIEHANQLSEAELAQASDPAFAHAPWFGPKYIQAHLPADRQEAEAIVVSTMKGGLALKDMPKYYHAWPDDPVEIRKKARAVPDLWEKGELRPAAGKILQQQGLAEAEGLVLPVIGQTLRGSAVLRKSDLAVVGIVPGLLP
jgi:hypothetical protein